MKKWIIILSSFIVLLILSVGCKSSDNQPLRLGTMPTYSAAIYAVGIEQGFFEDAGVNVELTVYKSSLDRDSAASAGNLDGFMTDIMGAINLNAKGFEFVMTSREFEEFGVVASPEVDIQTIDSPRIGISENSVIEYIVDTYLPYKSTKVPILAVPDRMGALLGGTIDYGVFPQPFMGIILSKGGQSVFTTSQENFQPVVLVFDRDLVEKKEATVVAFYEGYKKTVEYMQSHPFSEYKDALIVHSLATEDAVDGFSLPVENYGLFPVEEKTFLDITRWMQSKKILDQDIAFESIHTSKFIEK